MNLIISFCKKTKGQNPKRLHGEEILDGIRSRALTLKPQER